MRGDLLYSFRLWKKRLQARKEQYSFQQQLLQKSDMYYQQHVLANKGWQGFQAYHTWVRRKRWWGEERSRYTLTRKIPS